jgi:hypothetical protein
MPSHEALLTPTLKRLHMDPQVLGHLGGLLESAIKKAVNPPF